MNILNYLYICYKKKTRPKKHNNMKIKEKKK